VVTAGIWEAVAGAGQDSPRPEPAAAHDGGSS